MIKEANIYFDGKVASRAIILANGTKQTLGVRSCTEAKWSMDLWWISQSYMVLGR